MGIFSGYVGYQIQEVNSGIANEHFEEKFLRGNLTVRSVDLSYSDYLSTDLALRQTVSVVGDEFAFKNWMNIRYVVIDGVKWRAINVAPDKPRINITLGGLYNG